MGADAQAKGLRLWLYVFCSECARLIDLAEGNRQQRHHSAPARRKETARNRPISSGSVPDHMTLMTGVNDLDAQIPSPIWGCDFQFGGGAPGSRAG